MNKIRLNFCKEKPQPSFCLISLCNTLQTRIMWRKIWNYYSVSYATRVSYLVPTRIRITIILDRIVRVHGTSFILFLFFFYEFRSSFLLVIIVRFIRTRCAHADTFTNYNKNSDKSCLGKNPSFAEECCAHLSRARQQRRANIISYYYYYYCSSQAETRHLSAIPASPCAQPKLIFSEDREIKIDL